MDLGKEKRRICVRKEKLPYEKSERLVNVKTPWEKQRDGYSLKSEREYFNGSVQI